MLGIQVLLFAALATASYSLAPWASARSSLPIITVHLAAGAAARWSGLVGGAAFDALLPVHSAALGCITIAAGSAASQSSSAPGAAAASFASFPSSPGVALDIFGCTRLGGLWLQPQAEGSGEIFV